MADPDVSKGVPTESLTAEWYNRAVAKIKAIADVKGSHPIVVDRKERTVVRIDRTQGFYATLSGSSSPYSFTEKYGSSGGGWSTGVRTGTTNAYEANGTSGLSGKTVWLEPGWPGDYRFQHVGSGGSGCGGSPATLTVTVNTCGYARPGVTVNAVNGATTVSGTTNSSGQVSLSLTAAGVWTVSPVVPTARIAGSTTNVTVLCGTTYYHTFNLNAATGYHCVAGCWEPMPNTLYYSDACTSPVSDTITSGNAWNFISDCRTHPSFIMYTGAEWIATTPSTGHWRLNGSMFQILPIGTFYCDEPSDHDPADAVNATYSAITGGTDPTPYSGSPWDMVLTE